jgi:hypothetical protein
MSLGEVFGQQTTDDPNWQGVTITYWGSADLINGTGPIRGGGTYKGDIHSPDQIVNAWQGEYEL